MIEFNEYQQRTTETAIYPEDTALMYLALGLAGEAGEVAGKVKKTIRDGWVPGVSEQIAAELGDVLWYLARLADELGYGLDQVAESNLTKLFGRKLRGTLSGSGDNR